MNMYLRLLVLMISARLRPRLSLWDSARTTFRVNLADLDPLMHMNNGRYLSLLDLGRTDLMLRSGFWPVISERGWYPVVAGQTITYYRSLKLFERFEVHTEVMGADERWIYMHQRFVRRGDLVADAVVRARFLRRTGGSVDVAEVLEAAGGLPEGREIPDWVAAWNEGSSRRSGR